MISIVLTWVPSLQSELRPQILQFSHALIPIHNTPDDIQTNISYVDGPIHNTQVTIHQITFKLTFHTWAVSQTWCHYRLYYSQKLPTVYSFLSESVFFAPYYNSFEFIWWHLCPFSSICKNWCIIDKFNSLTSVAMCRKWRFNRWMSKDIWLISNNLNYFNISFLFEMN